MKDVHLDQLAARTFSFGGVEFALAPLGGVQGDKLIVVKPQEQVERYQAILERHHRPRMVEMGIAYGGSIALSALMAAPTRLVALELSDRRQPLLDAFISDHGLEDRVRLHYGVDQADSARLRSIMESEFGHDPLDLVVDDASHLYPETVSAFETLFPLLRPGGDYVIEDWNCDHGIRSLIESGLNDPNLPYHDWARGELDGAGEPDRARSESQTSVGASSFHAPVGEGMTPLSLLGLQLVLAVAEHSPGIETVTVGPYWVHIVRDSTVLEPGGFKLGAVAADHFGMLTTSV